MRQRGRRGCAVPYGRYRQAWQAAAGVAAALGLTTAAAGTAQAGTGATAGARAARVPVVVFLKEVRGTLYVGDFAASMRFLSGSQLIALPYSYRIGRS